MNRQSKAHNACWFLLCHRAVWHFVAMVTVLSTLSSRVTAEEVADQPATPKKSELKAFIVEALEGQPGFDAEGLINRSQATRVVARLNAKGWKVADPQELLERTLPDNDFLIRQFSDAAGKKFLERIGNVDGAIDRVDRLARMPQGETNINDLIRKVPNGYEWITSMSNTAHGRRMAKSLENAEGGQNFNEPTGRIYTVADLVRGLDGRLIRK